VRPDALRALLTEFYRDKLALILRHQAGARFVTQYDFNNTYQYIIGREDTQLGWVGAAIADLGGSVPAPADVAAPTIPDAAGADRQRAIIDADARAAQQFVDAWRPKVAPITNARHRGMLNVILGETLEHKRFFEQALEGRVDLHGRHADGAGSRGEVLATRWLE
jgi:hypothetical protein